MTRPMMLYAAFMLALNVTLLKRLFVVPKKEFIEDSKEVFEQQDPKVLRWVGLFTACLILAFFWLVALDESSQRWMLGYAAYKTIDVVIGLPKAIKPEGKNYPSLFRKLATGADLLVILYFIVDRSIHLS